MSKKARDKPVAIDGSTLSIRKLIEVARKKVPVHVTEEAISSIVLASEMIERIIREKKPVYTITTGVAGLSNTVIDSSTSEEFQKRILFSCAVGVGEPFSEEIVRGAILCRLNTFASGHSGVRVKVVEFLEDLLNNQIYPYVPEQGSLGCSGDIAPLAHIGLLALGEGEVFGADNKRRPAKEFLTSLRIKPVKLRAKEAVSLVNGCSLSAGLSAIGCNDALNFLKSAEIAAAMSIEALEGSSSGFSLRLSSLKPHPGQAKVAKDILELIKGSSFLKPSQNDPYTIKAVPQVLGSASDALDYAERVSTTEINSSSDNPLLFPKENEIISGANFHAQEVAFVMDALAIALAPVGDLAERRVERLLNPSLSNNLPPYLVNKPGINSGFLDAQFTVAALAEENKTLCVPASINPSSVSGATEDHASQAPVAGRKLLKLVSNLEFLVGIELLCAAQALDLRLAKDKSRNMGQGTLAAHEYVRSKVPFLEEDRILYPDFEKIKDIIHSGKLVLAVEAEMGELLRSRERLAYLQGP